MSTDLITVKPTDTLKDVRNIFLRNRIHHLPVIDDQAQLLGLVTTYDLFKQKVAPEDYANTLVKDIMTVHLATLEPHEKIGAAAEIFLERLFHAVPVTIKGKLVGIITSFDILKYEFKKEYPRHFDVQQ